MQPWLGMYLNGERARLLSAGFSEGFYVPQFEGDGCLFSDNLQPVNFNLDVVRSKLAGEVREGRMAGPFSSPSFNSFQVSPLGLVPKKKPNSFRLIHHLSHPE